MTALQAPSIRLIQAATHCYRAGDRRMCWQSWTKLAGMTAILILFTHWQVGLMQLYYKSVDPSS